MKKPAHTVLGSLLLMTCAPGTILLNEININPAPALEPDPDLNYEYIELRSSTNGVEACTGLTILIIDNDGGQVGEVEEAISLDPLSTGANGLLLIGSAYDSAPGGGPWSGFKAAGTVTADPAGTPPYSSLSDNDISPNGGLTFLLVSGWTGMSNASPASLGDVDVNNNSVLDWQEAPNPAGSQLTQPYTELVDSIGYRDLGNIPVRLPYTTPTADVSARPGSAATFAPDNISRRQSRAVVPADQNNSSAWYGGNFGAATSLNAIVYVLQFFGDFKGQGTPGQPNLNAVPVDGSFLINEIGINPSGTGDGNFEYIEIVNTVVNDGSLTSSLHGHALVLVGSRAGASLGRILEAWDLGAMSTGPNGLLLLGNEYPLGRAPWGKYIDPLTQLGDPRALDTRYSDMADADVGSNNGFTLLLVRSFTGIIDEAVGNAAGVLTAQPWTSIVDSVGFDEIDLNGALLGGKTYALAKLDPTYTEAGQTKHYNPDHVARKLGNTTANSGVAWYGGRLAAGSPYGIALGNGFYIGGFRGEATPGRTNLAATPAAGAVRLNEVHLNPPTDTDDTEYIEVINPDGGIVGMNDLWILVVSATPTDRGFIRSALDLRGMSTGPDGLAIFGDDFEETSNPWVPSIPASTLRDDPLSFNDDSTRNPNFNFGTDFIKPNGGAAILLVRGFTGALNQDLDADGNGSFEAPPWSQLVDSISFGVPVDPSVAFVTFPGFSPGNLSRFNGMITGNSASSWYGGELDGTAATSTDYSSHWIGPFKGAASPGRLNHSAAPNSSIPILLNELNINPPAGDTNREFIELTSANRQSISTNNYTILLLSTLEGTDVGRVVEAWSLDGLSTGTNGLLLTGSGYVATDGLPWTGSDAIAAATRIGSPAGMDFDDIGRTSDNGANTILLVKDFSGRIGDDLDPLDGGTLPAPNPWSELVDAAGMRRSDAPPRPTEFSGRVYGGVDLSQIGYTPDNASRYLDNLTARSKSAWYGGDIAGGTGTSLGYDNTQRFPGGLFIGAVTPGKPNLTLNTDIDDLGDDDNDGVVNIVEVALGMAIIRPDAHKLPTPGTVLVGGANYPTISFTRPSGGATTPPNKYAKNGLFYTVQFSVDCVTWSDTTQISGVTAVEDPALEAARYRPTSTAFAQGQAAGQMFLRLKVSRQP